MPSRNTVERPGGAVRPRSQVDRLRGRAGARGEPRAGDEAGGRLRIGEVEEGERDIRGVPRQGLRCGLARILGRLGLGGRGPEFAERREPPGDEHLLRSLVHDSENAADRVFVVTYGAIRKREVALLEVSVAIERQLIVVERDRLAGVHPVEHRAHDRPQLRVRFLGGSAHRSRVLPVAEDRPVRVVVEQIILRAPHDSHREPGREHCAHQRLQAAWPRRHRAQHGSRPVDGAHELPRLPAPCHEVEAAAVEAHRSCSPITRIRRGSSTCSAPP